MDMPEVTYTYIYLERMRLLYRTRYSNYPRAGLGEVSSFTKIGSISTSTDQTGDATHFFPVIPETGNNTS